MTSDLSSEARDLLRAARSFDDPSEADLRRVRATVMIRVGAAGIGAAIGATMSSFSFAGVEALFGSTAAKIGAAVLVVAGLSAGSHVGTRSHFIARPAVVVDPSRESVAPALPRSSIAVDDSVPGEAQPAEVSGRGRTAASRGAHPRRQTPDLDGEVHLLEQADAELRRGDNGAAIERLNEHALRYPSGALSEEREGVRAIALCRGGKVEGKSMADRFLAATRKSALANRVRAACGIERSE